MHEYDFPIKDGLQYKICENKVKIKGISSGDQAEEWLKEYGKSRNIVWRVLRTFPQTTQGKGRVFSYKKDFRCQHDTKYRSDGHTNGEKRKHTSKNTNCPAEARIAIRRKPQSRRRQLQYLETSIFDFGCTVTFINNHNHITSSGNDLKKAPKKEARQLATRNLRECQEITSEPTNNTNDAEDHEVIIVADDVHQQVPAEEKHDFLNLDAVYSLLDKNIVSMSHSDQGGAAAAVVLEEFSLEGPDRDFQDEFSDSNCVFLIVNDDDTEQRYLANKEAKLMKVFEKIKCELQSDPKTVGPAIDMFCEHVEMCASTSTDLISGLSTAFKPVP